MYQVIINDKFYIKDLDGAHNLNNEYVYVYNFTVTKRKLEGKFFEYEKEAESIADKVDGRVIKYVEDKEITINCSVTIDDIYKQLKGLKND